MGIEALVPESPDERLASLAFGSTKALPVSFARAREVQLRAVFIGPAIQRLRDELGTIVHPNGTGTSAQGRDPCHCLDNLLSLAALSDVNRQRLVG